MTKMQAIKSALKKSASVNSKVPSFAKAGAKEATKKLMKRKS